MKYLIIGLGNIGAEYENTRHNIGFDVVDRLSKELNGEFKIERHAFRSELKFKGRKLILLKPTTFMNLSGKAVKYWMTTEKVSADNIIVILDDLAIPLGKLRMKLKGGDGNHNGLTSIIENLGNNVFPRLRFGIGSDFRRGYQSDFVLGKWTSEENVVVDERIDLAIEFVKSFVSIGAQRTMTALNNK
ncbi:MAG: aminoacyl-tRNA hydrolase [Bacteroidales bacterium]|nr:aminoacyl-tRNA hydrolase [Bacteroidales bacterium]